MLETTVVFVHGFRSSPECWDPLVTRLEADTELDSQGYRFVRFGYPTRILEWRPGKRIPTVEECGGALGDFLKRLPKCDQLFLVGHSMGGLVIQSFLAQQIHDQRGRDLAKIRAVILFATPNRGSNFMGSVRSIVSAIWDNPQLDDDLKVLDHDTAKVSDVIASSIIGATRVDEGHCPVPFRVFWGLQDDIVPEVSARGAFVEASGLKGGHSEVIQCDPKGPDERYEAFRFTLLNPPGHPQIHEIDLFEVTLAVSPVAPASTFTLQGEVRPLSIQTDNVAIRTIRILVSDQNRCAVPYEQMYRSRDGLVELLSLTKPNDAEEKDKSTYFDGGKLFTYVFTPDRGREYSIKLRIYNGFGQGERTWHNHMKVNARYKLFRFVLNLKTYQEAGYRISQEPNMYFYPQDTGDHTLCANRVGADPLPGLAFEDPWVRTWEIPNVQGGVIDLVWDVAAV